MFVYLWGKVKSAYGPMWPTRPELIPVSVAWSDLEYFYSPLDGMLVHRRVTPSNKFAGTHLYTCVERVTVRVKCLAQEHNTMSPARARTRTSRSGVERTNHEVKFVNSFPINKGSAISQRLLSNITGKKLTWQCLVFNAIVTGLSAYKLFSKSSLQVFGGSEMGRNYHWVSWNWYILMLLKKENYLTKISYFM